MTPLLITLLSARLKALLPGSRLASVGNPDGETVTLTFFHPEHRHLHLVAALFPTRPFLFLADGKPASKRAPSNFVSSLRKHLESSRVVSVEQGPGERIVILRFQAVEGGSSLLAFEALPKYPNLILAGADGNIVSAYRYKDEVERPVVPGAPYAPPPRTGPHSSRSNEEGPSLWDAAVDAEALNRLWTEAGRPDMGSFLKGSLRGADPQMVRHLSTLGEETLERIPLLREKAVRGEWGPCEVRRGADVTLHLFPGDAGGGTPFDDVHTAAGEFYRAEKEHRIFHQERRRFESEVRRTLKREQRVLLKLKDDRARAEKADQFQWWGELLMAQLHLVAPHTSGAELEDVVRGTGRKVSVPLDASLPAVENAQRLFRKARKGERGLALVEKREREVSERVHALKSALRSLPSLALVEEVRRARKDLFPGDPVVERTRPERPKAEKIPTPNVHREKVAPGLELCAGSSAAANEYVTFQLARPDDLWFHARDYPGAHVVLRRLDRSAKFTDETVMLAARHAAGHCKVKAGGKVTVSYTERKYVRRIPGGPAGLVTLTNERSLVIETSPKEAT